MRMRTKTIACVVFAFAVVGVYAHYASISDNQRYFRMRNPLPESEIHLIESDQTARQNLDSLQASIPPRIREIKILQEKQQYLYNKLFNATVDLERNSTLDLNLIARIGPGANLYLRDLTGTTQAAYAVLAYEANLPPDSPVRDITSDLLVALRSSANFKSKYQEKIRKWRSEETERELDRQQREAELARREAERREQEFQMMLNQQILEYPEQPPQVQPTPEEMGFRTATDIIGENGNKLGLTHAIMADIDITQTKIVALTNAIIRDYQRIDNYRMQLTPPTRP